MAETVLDALVWFTAIGLLVFLVLYSFLTPWKDPMGRHIFFFMLSLLLAFIYGVVNKSFSFNQRIEGWIIVITAIAGVVWWRVIILMIFLYKDQDRLKQEFALLKNKVRRK